MLLSSVYMRGCPDPSSTRCGSCWFQLLDTMDPTIECKSFTQVSMRGRWTSNIARTVFKSKWQKATLGEPSRYWTAVVKNVTPEEMEDWRFIGRMQLQPPLENALDQNTSAEPGRPSGDGQQYWCPAIQRRPSGLGTIPGRRTRATAIIEKLTGTLTKTMEHNEAIKTVTVLLEYAALFDFDSNRSGWEDQGFRLPHYALPFSHRA